MSLPRPPVINQVTEESGLITGEWNRWFNEIYALLNESLISAPSDASYIIRIADTLLSEAQVLANLSTGFVKVTNGTGLLTSQAQILPTDILGGGSPLGAAGGALSGTYPNPQLGTQTQALNMGTHQINNLAEPSLSTDATTKNYVDNATSVLGQNITVIAASTANIVGTYNNGNSGIGATLTCSGTGITIDSIPLSVNNVILLQSQTTAFQNGVYVATAVNNSTLNYTFTRASNYNTPALINNTSAISVLQGSLVGKTQRALVAQINNIGVDSLTYARLFFNVADSDVQFTNITTGDATAVKHGYIIKLNSTANKILYTDGVSQTWSTPTFPVSSSATSGKVMISDGTNWVASPETFAAPGSSGNVMTSDGTNWVSSASGSGAMVLISRQTVSASASIDFTSIAAGTYDHYVIYCSNILLATLGNLLLRYSIAGSFKSDAGYSDQAIRTTFNSSGSSGSAATDTGMPINSTSEPIGTTTGTSAFDAIIHIGNCAQTTDKKRSMWQSTYKSSNNITITNMGGGWYNTNATAAIDGFRLIADSGNIASGTIALWGIKNS